MNQKIDFSNELSDKILTDEELMLLFKRMQSGESECKQLIIKYNIRLVYYVLYRDFKNMYKYHDDLASYGILGLIKAIDTFKPKYNIKFNTYAYKCIKNHMLIGIRKLNGSKREVSLDQIMENMDDSDEEKSEKIFFSPNVNMEDDILDKVFLQGVERFLDILPKRNREILKLYFGFKDGKCYMQSELAEMFLLSQSTISIIFRKSLAEIKEFIEVYNYNKDEYIKKTKK